MHPAGATKKKKKTVVTESGSTLIWDDLVLDYVCKDPISKEGHVHGCQGSRTSDHTIPRSMCSLCVLREQGSIGLAMGHILYTAINSFNFIKASAQASAGPGEKGHQWSLWPEKPAA